ncbi:hypothetical protein [Dialister invisus]|uniref:hypothetical protein n=1 Tax=Dialister invisus TaxID=218538 RepID=UPI003AAC094A
MREMENSSVTRSEDSATRMMLTTFLATGIDSSHLLRMTINVSLIMTADPLLAIRMTSFIPCHYDAFHSLLLVTRFP